MVYSQCKMCAVRKQKLFLCIKQKDSLEEISADESRKSLADKEKLYMRRTAFQLFFFCIGKKITYNY